MDLDRHELVLKVDVLEARLLHHALHLVQEALLADRAQVGEIYFCFFHVFLLAAYFNA